jgi:hypothetical protein
MIRAVLRPFVIPRLRRAYAEALDAVREAQDRRDTRAIHAAHKRARKALHRLMEAGG